MKTYKVTVDGYGTIRWYNEANSLHRENGPAIERANGTKEYWKNGKLHRENGPDGALPAVEYANGSKTYYVNGQVHREDGPAINWGINKSYYLNGISYCYEEWLKLTNNTKELTVEQIGELLGYEVKIVKG